VVVTTSVAAQTHVPYLVNAIALDALVVGLLVWRWRRGAASARLVAGTVATGAVLWLPPVVEQLVRADGNIAKLVRHLTTADHEPAIGLTAAVKIVVRHL